MTQQTPASITEPDPRETAPDVGLSGNLRTPLPVGPFLVEHYQDWSDYPGWEAYEDDEGHEVRFPTVGEARAWIEHKREVDNAAALAAWEANEVKIKAAQERHDERMRVLDEAGLGKQEGEYRVLWNVPTGYKRPDPEKEKNFRVALDAERCPTCGVRSRGGNFPAKGDES